MSIGAFNPGVTGPLGASTGPPVGEALEIPAPAEVNADIWSDIDRALRTPKLWADLRPEPTTARAQTAAIRRPSYRQVSAGVRIPEEEFNARFGSLPIAKFRQTMPPPVFEAFVTFVGRIDGRGDFDALEATELPED